MTRVRFAGLLGMAMMAGVAAGCVSDIVYRDKPLFEDPPQSAVGFLGYSNVDQQQTTCGNCHSGQQTKWVTTKHASAWADLQANAGKADACNDCHTVSGLGNTTAAGVKVGYAATKDARYQDVQCESCHGSGLEHVKDPSTNATKPLASVVAAEDRTNGCGGCHTDTHHPFVAEWEASKHGEVQPVVAADYAVDPVGRASCMPCHEGRFAMKQLFGVTNNFAERDNIQPTNLVGITCAVCHDPHGNGNASQLRKPANGRTIETNLCTTCHNRRGKPDGTTARNYPHAAQGPMIFGDVGWKPPTFPTDEISGTHSSEANPGLCATCHLAKYAVNDKATGKFIMNTTGHLFKALPCLDASGVPTANEDCTMSQRSAKGCVSSGCHGTETAARSAVIASEGRLTNLSTELKRLVALAKIKAPGDYKSDTNVTPLEGLDFNSKIMEHDLSRGAHNPFYLDALLNTSITYIKSQYGVQ